MWFFGSLWLCFELSFKLQIISLDLAYLVVYEKAKMCISQKVNFIDIRRGNFLYLYSLNLLYKYA